MAADDSLGPSLTVQQAARATGLSAKALRRRIERGSLRSTLAGGLRRIPMSDLLEAGLLVPYDERSGGGDGPSVAPAAASGAVLDAGVLLERLERQAEEIGELRARAGRAEALERELEAERSEWEQAQRAMIVAEGRIAELERRLGE